ncbi:MAG: class I SAM-dependent methyltransferase [Clostridia bacterium]|jgi:SAM-dependent methyltransferase
MKHNEEDNTIEYYNINAEDFIQRTIDIDMGKCYGLFLNYLKPGQTILDLGCGSGRDSKYFLESGFNVVSIDGSPVLCKRASEYIGQEVICNRFEDITYEDKFDGVWACASLLHVKREVLPDILRLISKALKRNGYLYASFKYGWGERITEERLFNGYTEKDIDLLFNSHNGLKCLHYYVTEDARADRKDEKWLTVIAQNIGCI